MTYLREFHRTTGNNESRVKVGDVFLHDDGPPIKRKLAVIEELLPGRDGHVWAVDIRTQGGMTNGPIAKLYPLEVTAQPRERYDLPVNQHPRRSNWLLLQVRHNELQSRQKTSLPSGC